ncbi:MAG: TonB family protein [Flavobacteriales bacterium]|nr:TonB family protein [Flavobacteriales bacterium]
MEVLIHLAKANAVFALLFGAYLLVLRRETFFIANRIWLVSSTVMALLLPFVQWSTAFSPLAGRILPSVMTGADAGTSRTGLSWEMVLLFVYSAGVVLYLVRLVIDIRNAWVASGAASPTEGLSFLGRVSIPENLTGADREAMIAHEWVHVRHGHTADVLLLRLVHAFNWFNPLWLLALRELRLVHEHTADAIACERHSDYDHLLLAQALGIPTHALTNNFRSSNLKKRMTMLHRRPSSLAAGSKYLFALPLLFAAVSFAAPSRSASPVRTIQSNVVVQAERMPEFPGGNEAMMEFVVKELKYPEAARKAGKEGKVFVGFVVDAEGAVTKVVVKRGVDPAIDAEAVRVVSAMPKWKPGMDAGKPVAVEMVLPLVFELEDEKKP